MTGEMMVNTMLHRHRRYCPNGIQPNPDYHTSLHRHLATVPIFCYSEKGGAVRGHLSPHTPTPQHPLDITQFAHAPTPYWHIVSHHHLSIKDDDSLCWVVYPTSLPLAGGLNVSGDELVEQKACRIEELKQEVEEAEWEHNAHVQFWNLPNQNKGKAPDRGQPSAPPIPDW
ncbi:hypothetical protein ARMSODRAFT_977004 [Armillaria solidipes]|uniref:Uncharacterized protein n=1 Tax=Armillaria solidipes TaxID=1076256 RepID=A0A2H3BTW2_9AGAR|nr:hypothetical protein ARMSODRAFT_977004 [Armillaria solidipes]